MLQVLRDLSGNFLTDEQRQVRGLKTWFTVLQCCVVYYTISNSACSSGSRF
jgi:hypothetical protein